MGPFANPGRYTLKGKIAARLVPDLPQPFWTGLLNLAHIPGWGIMLADGPEDAFAPLSRRTKPMLPKIAPG